MLSEAALPERAGPAVRELARDYLSLLKPRIVALLVLTAVAAMVPAAHGLPRLGALLAVLVGGALAAGGASSINCYLDRDIDAEMPRTRRRPIPGGRLPAWHALAVGLALNAAAFAVLTALANLWAALLALAGTLIYVFVYTLWLKRSTPQNIVIGGAAGAMPPLVGWVAASGHLDWTALALFAIVFLWTPAHFWALAQVLRTEYATVRVPMLPVVAGGVVTRRRSLWYAALTLTASLVPFVTHAEGVLYLAGASALGAGLVGVGAWNLVRPGAARLVFLYSMLYLAALFALLAIGALVG